MQNPGTYAPVQIRNPISRNHFVRLLPGQKLLLVFTMEAYYDARVDIIGKYLSQESVQAVRGGFVYHIKQNNDYSALSDTLFLLGEVRIYNPGISPPVDSSLCIVQESTNQDFVRVMGPVQPTFVRIDPHQVVNVVYYSNVYHEDWECFVTAGLDGRLEQIDKTRRYLPPNLDYVSAAVPGAYPVEEHSFRFRLDAPTIELFQEKTQGRYDGGTLLFSRRDTYAPGQNLLHVTVNWKEHKKGQMYKALLLPKNEPPPCLRPTFRRKRQVMRSQVTLRKIECADMDTGCNVIFSRCY